MLIKENFGGKNALILKWVSDSRNNSQCGRLVEEVFLDSVSIQTLQIACM